MNEKRIGHCQHEVMVEDGAVIMFNDDDGHYAQEFNTPAEVEAFIDVLRQKSFEAFGHQSASPGSDLFVRLSDNSGEERDSSDTELLLNHLTEVVEPQGYKILGYGDRSATVTVLNGEEKIIRDALVPEIRKIIAKYERIPGDMPADCFIHDILEIID